MDSIDELARSARRWRTAFFAALIGLIAVVGLAAYTMVDQGVTATYREEAHSDVSEQLEIALRLMPAVSGTTSRSGVLASLRAQHPNALITEADSTIQIRGLVFRFAGDGSLESVTTE